MSGCDKIEALLWERAYGTISGEDGELLRKHLEDCAACRKVQSTIEALGESRKSDEDVISRIDADDFEIAVFQKIKTLESELRHRQADKSYMMRMYFSVGLAAAIVAFIVFSMADLERFVIPSKPLAYLAGGVDKEYDTIQIKLQPKRADVANESAGLTGEEKSEKADEKVITASGQPSPEVSEPDLRESDVADLFQKKQEMQTPSQDITPRLLTRTPVEKTVPELEMEQGLDKVEVRAPGEYRPTKLKRRESFMAAGRLEESGKDVAATGDQFQILNRPVTKPAPESVAINSIYLSDQSIPLNSQITQAFLPEVIVDSGIIQAVETPRSILATVEKMPVPIKIFPPEYPLWAKKNGISGTVWVKAHVNEEGDVETAEIASSSNPGYGFEEASLEAAKQCKYLPAEANGYKIAIWVIYPVNFVFKNN